MALTSLQGIDWSDLNQSERARLNAFVTGIVRRWGLLFLVAGLNAGAGFLNLTVVGDSVIWFTALVLAMGNFSLSTLPRGAGFRPSFLHVAVTADLIVLSTPVVFTGIPGLAPLLLLGLIPYASGESPGVRIGHSLGAAAVLMAALSIHAELAGSAWSSAVNPSNLLAAVTVLAAGFLLRWREGSRLARIDATRDVVNDAAAGALYRRIEAEEEDELGHLANAIDSMMNRISDTIADVQRETSEVSAFAEMLSLSAQGVLTSTQSVLETARFLAGEMDTQRERAEDGHDRTADAAAAAGSLRDRADQMAIGVQQLVNEAQIGRERVQRASETLIAIAEDVKTTATTVQDLSNMSNDIGNFVYTTSRIARQTHVLALNAAIEAAHSGSGNEGFSAVAEEVRALAATSSNSAREAAELIDTVQSHIKSVARSMSAGEEQVRDVGAVAREAKGALDALVRGASDVSELVRVTADISRSQALRVASLAEQMSEIASVNARTSADAQGAAAAMGNQRLTMEDLNTIATQLAGLAERLTHSVDRFDIHPDGKNRGAPTATKPES